MGKAKSAVAGKGTNRLKHLEAHGQYISRDLKSLRLDGRKSRKRCISRIISAKLFIIAKNKNKNKNYPGNKLSNIRFK